MTERLLVIFARYPEPGLVKTRLAAEVGAREAARTYRRCAEMVVTRVAAHAAGYDVELACSPARDCDKMAAWLGPTVTIRAQQGPDLGSRMHHAFTQGFDAGYAQVVIIGTDCPAVTEGHIRDAFERLDSAEVVLGPAADGGYYLIGLAQPHPRLFENIHWGTEQVLRQTLNACRLQGLTTALLSELRDIDRIEDLDFYRSEGFIL